MHELKVESTLKSQKIKNVTRVLRNKVAQSFEYLEIKHGEFLVPWCLGGEKRLFGVALKLNELLPQIHRLMVVYSHEGNSGIATLIILLYLCLVLAGQF